MLIPQNFEWNWARGSELSRILHCSLTLPVRLWTMEDNPVAETCGEDMMMSLEMWHRSVKWDSQHQWDFSLNSCMYDHWFCVAFGWHWFFAIVWLVCFSVSRNRSVNLSLNPLTYFHKHSGPVHAKSSWAANQWLSWSHFCCLPYLCLLKVLLIFSLQQGLFQQVSETCQSQSICFWQAQSTSDYNSDRFPTLPSSSIFYIILIKKSYQNGWKKNKASN
jgi:hypothetical protein